MAVVDPFVSASHVDLLESFAEVKEAAGSTSRVAARQDVVGLRGQFGTEDAMVTHLASGARFVVADTTVQRDPVLLSEIGLPFQWRIGPASLPVADDILMLIAKVS
jgi:hypothetical protein